MRILAVAFAYNEMKYIAPMVEYYRLQGCELNIIDNCSTDGTYEYLLKKGVRTRQKDTKGMFNLKKLQGSLQNDIREIKPDWIVYTGVDIKYVFTGTLRDEIERADASGYNVISVKHWNIFNTGEKFRLPLQDYYFYGRKISRLEIIAKYTEPFNFEADSIQVPYKRVYASEGILVNYGNCKPKAEREETLRRREKAWNAGLDRNYGVHYLEGKNRNWLWDKTELTDIRTMDWYTNLKKL